MAEPAVNVESYPPVPTEELQRYIRRFSWIERAGITRWSYTTNGGCVMNFRDIPIRGLEKIQINLELKGGKGNGIWHALEDEINRKKEAEGKA